MKKLTRPITIVLIAAFLANCGGGKSNDETKIVLSDIIPQDSIVIDDPVINDSIHSAGRGDTWKAWDIAFKACMENETFTKKTYLGPSNSKYLGTILSKGYTLTRRELDKLIPAADFTLFADTGKVVTNCDLKNVKEMSVDAVLGATINQMSDSLRVALSNYDSIQIVSGAWRIDEIRTGDFLDYVNNPDRKHLEGYRQSLAKRKNVVITKVVKVVGFSANLVTSKKLSVGVSAELPAASELSEGEVGISIKRKTDRIVSITSKSEFYVFAQIDKGRNLEE